MLTDPVVQLNSLYKGFSVQRDVENAYLAQTIADGEQTYAADPLTCDWDSLIEELGAPSVSSATIYDVTHEAAFDYYGNEIDLTPPSSASRKTWDSIFPSSNKQSSSSIAESFYLAL